MIFVRRNVSALAIQRPQPRTWVAITQLQSRHLSRSATVKDNGTNNGSANPEPAKETYHATDTPLAEELDALGLYRRSTTWHAAMRRRWLEQGGEQEVVAEGAKGSAASRTKGKRSSGRLTKLRRLASACKPSSRERTWKAILDLERAHLEKLATLDTVAAEKLESREDRPPQAVNIIRQALEKSDKGTLTEDEQKQMELALINLAPPEPGEPTYLVAKKKTFSNGDSPWARSAVKGDRTRVHVVNERLCNDVLKYIPSLDRHKGCDIIDMYPGAGLFSKKLNDLLQPRSHILLEPEPNIYSKFLNPLLQRPGTKLVPKSGIIWDDLKSILTPEYLPNQTPLQRIPGESPKRNDTLLVVANLGFYPNKPYMGFKSMVTMIMYQLITSIRLRNMFQKYGLVRMLIWVRPPEVDNILPQDLTKRRRPAAEAEMLTEYIAEICTSPERQLRPPGVGRHSSVDLHSARLVLDRMRESGIEVPKGRETSEFMRQVLAAETAGKELPPIGKAVITRPNKASGKKAPIEEPSEYEKGLSTWVRLRSFHWQGLLEKHNEAKSIWFKLRAKQAELDEGEKSPALVQEIKEMQEKFDKLAYEWNYDYERYSYKKAGMNKFIDDVRTFTSETPVLSWDRRPLEPFLASPTEFFPNVPLSLLDIQPKPMNPLLLESGKGSTRAADYFDLILSAMFQQRSKPLKSLMAGLGHGAVEGMDMDNIESFNDPVLGGPILGGNDVLRPCMMSERHLMDLLTAWMKWPFRPSFEEMATRNREDMTDED